MDLEKLKYFAIKLKEVREVKKRDNDQEFISYDYNKIEDSAISNLGDKLQAAVRIAHDNEMPNDFIYEQIDTVLDIILESETLEQLEERVLEIEPDVYNHELIGWIQGNRYHYLDEAKDLDPQDFSQLLNIAQYNHKQFIANTFLNELNNIEIN